MIQDVGTGTVGPPQGGLWTSKLQLTGSLTAFKLTDVAVEDWLLMGERAGSGSSLAVVQHSLHLCSCSEGSQNLM
jgi:hypothetical protein